MGDTAAKSEHNQIFEFEHRVVFAKQANKKTINKVASVLKALNLVLLKQQQQQQKKRRNPSRHSSNSWGTYFLNQEQNRGRLHEMFDKRD